MDWGACVQKGAASISCIFPLYQNVLSAAFMFAGTVAVIVIIVSGLKFLLSQGDPKKVQDAKTTMTYAVVGLLLIFFSGFIVSVFAKTFLRTPCIQMFGFDTCL